MKLSAALTAACRLPLTLFLALSLEGCGGKDGLFCGNTCPAGEIHKMYECGCQPDYGRTSSRGNTGGPGSSYNYYITRRYYCSDGGSCEVKESSYSCQAALDAEISTFNNTDDVCRTCSGIIDNSKHYLGRFDDLQGGPCQGVYNELDNRNSKMMSYLARKYISDTQNYLDNISSYLRFIAAPIVTSPTPNKTVDACASECSSRSPTCLRLSLGGDVDSGLKKLYSALIATPNHLTESDVMKMFSQSQDPCKRGESSIDKGIFSNKGEGGACEFGTDLPLTNVRIIIPELLRGRIIIGSGEIRAIFENSEFGGSLSFSNISYESKHGGIITSLKADQQFIYFIVGNNTCVRAKY